MNRMKCFVLKYMFALALIATARGAKASSILFWGSCEVHLAPSSAIRSEIKRIISHPKIEFAVSELGKKYRSGWRLKGVPDQIGETVLEHSIKVMTAATLYPINREKLDRRRMALMAFFHDIAEFEVEDYTPFDPITKEAKHDLERRTITRLAQETGEVGQLILNLWDEYESQSTKEAQIVMQLDKLDAAIQAFEYEKNGFDVSSFFSTTAEKLSDPLLKSILEKLIRRENPERKSYEQYFELLSSLEVTN